MAREYTINVGCNDPRVHRQILPTFIIKRKIIKVLAKYFDGFTMVKATGFYKGEKENSFILYFYDTTLERVTDCAEELREELKQESVIVSTRIVKSAFIEK